MRLLTILGLAILATGCGTAEVNIRNHSSAVLRDVVIAATGTSTRVDALGPSTEARASICPEGEVGEFALSFRANGHLYRTTQTLYFECSASYRIQVDVSPEFVATAGVSLK